MKILIVSQAGKVADVTLQSSCKCMDEAALKVFYIKNFILFNKISRPPSLSALTPIIFNMELTHLGSKASN